MSDSIYYKKSIIAASPDKYPNSGRKPINPPPAPPKPPENPPPKPPEPVKKIKRIFVLYDNCNQWYNYLLFFI